MLSAAISSLIAFSIIASSPANRAKISARFIGKWQEAAFADPSPRATAFQRQGGDTVPAGESSPPDQAADGGDGRDLLRCRASMFMAGIIPDRPDGDDYFDR